MAVMHFVWKLPIKNTDEENLLIGKFCVALVNISERFFLWFCLSVDYSCTVYSLRDSLLSGLFDLCKFAA